MTAQPWKPARQYPARYPGRVDDVIVTSDGPQRITLTPPPPTVPTGLALWRRTTKSPSRLGRLLRPARTAREDALIARYRWANDGLRERLAELERRRLELDDQLATLAAVHARVLGHAHPVVLGIRAILDEAPR